MKRRLPLVLLITWLMPQAVLAQGVGIAATVINSDFSHSWAALQDLPDGETQVTIHAQNTGDLTSKAAHLSLVLSSSWEYVGTSGEVGIVQSGEKPYGEYIDWQLQPLAKGQEADVSVRLRWPTNSARTPLLISLSSMYSIPVYVELQEAPVTGEKQPLWSSWIRSTTAYVSLTVQEFWYRLVTGVKLSLGSS